jgi:hypothetical protein
MWRDEKQESSFSVEKEAKRLSSVAPAGLFRCSANG